MKNALVILMALGCSTEPSKPPYPGPPVGDEERPLRIAHTRQECVRVLSDDEKRRSIDECAAAGRWVRVEYRSVTCFADAERTNVLWWTAAEQWGDGE